MRPSEQAAVGYTFWVLIVRLSVCTDKAFSSKTKGRKKLKKIELEKHSASADLRQAYWFDTTL